MYIIISYDIVENRSRTKFAKLLSKYLTRVQKSVFEGEIEERDLLHIKLEIPKLIDFELDSVRIYQLCSRCDQSVEIVGKGLAVYELKEEDDVVV